MSYLEEFHALSDGHNPTRFLRLWEEYCLADTVDGEELVKILHLIKDSSLSSFFGEYAETVLPLWKQIQDTKSGNEVLRYVLDLQTSNSPILADLAIEYLKKQYPTDKHFNEKLRIVGLRGRQHFQGAITNFELITHMSNGNFVFHTGGWGVGEIMEASLLREHVLVEFEGIGTVKDVSFDNAFKNLEALPVDHFLARRFGNPDSLEKEAKEDPGAIIHLLLRDLGPKTTAEIKDALCDLVIPEKDWPKWWQSARAKLKKDTKIKSPDHSKDPFILREEAVSHESRFKDALKQVRNTESLIQTIYNFTRDFPEVLKNNEFKEQIKELLQKAKTELNPSQEFAQTQLLQISFLLEDIFSEQNGNTSIEIIQKLSRFETLLSLIEIVAFKKRVLVKIRDNISEWRTFFLQLIFLVEQSPLRDYIFKELFQDEKSKPLLIQKLKDLLNTVTIYPDAFFWYFQKVTSDENVPLNDQEHKRHFLEAFLILLHYAENMPDRRDLVKKMHQFLTAKRYAVFRSIIQDASLEYLQELLLLASKCGSFTKQDHRILESLCEVVHPSLGAKKKEESKKEETIWTTAEGYKKVQERILHIGTVETVDNAREIEAARALGDLRENSEYKFALERRARLQAELKMLTRQLNQARILTREDISTDMVGVGSIVDVVDSKGTKSTFTLLGPWDANPDQHVLSFQSKLAQAMIGCKKNESFDFQGEKFVVKGIKSFL